MKKLLLTLLTGLFLLSVVSAGQNCDPQHHNMHHVVPMPAQPAPTILNPQHILPSDCCKKPIYNNHQLPEMPVRVIQVLDQQHIIKDDCCRKPIYNNHQLVQPVTPRTTTLDRLHFVNTCMSCNS